MSRRNKRKDRIHKNIAPMPPDFKKKLLPYAAIKLLTGGKAYPSYKKKDNLVRIHWGGEDDVLHVEDFQIVKAVTDVVWKEQVEEKNLLCSMTSLPTVIMLHHMCAEKIAAIVDNKIKTKKKIMFIKDQSGCGYWRMVVPARYMKDDEYHIDMAETDVTYDYLLEYDVIVVQRLHSWREYYTVERLKRQGKRIVYDIDDDIFSVPDDNPAARIVKRDQQEAARAIMGICDSVTTTTELLKEKLGCPDKTIVIPNAIDLEDGYPSKYSDPEDDIKRILWMGSATHERDWMQCASAVDRVMRDTKDVRLVILGYLPAVVAQFVNDESRPWWDARVEFSGFQEIETYVMTTKHLRANCALAPLEDTPFNCGKSNIKFLEYTGAGIPTIASNVSPYKEDIQDGVNGTLVETEDDWYNAIMAHLEDSGRCSRVVDAAVQMVNEKYDVKKIVSDWEKAILG